MVAITIVRSTMKNKFHWKKNYMDWYIYVVFLSYVALLLRAVLNVFWFQKYKKMDKCAKNVFLLLIKLLCDIIHGAFHIMEQTFHVARLWFNTHTHTTKIIALPLCIICMILCLTIISYNIELTSIFHAPDAPCCCLDIIIQHLSYMNMRL